MRWSEWLQVWSLLVVVIGGIATLPGCKRAEARSLPIVMAVMLDPTDSNDEEGAAVFVADMDEAINAGRFDNVTIAGVVRVDTHCDFIPLETGKDKRTALRDAVVKAMKEASPCATQPKVTRCGTDVYSAVLKCDAVLSREPYRSHRKILLAYCDGRSERCAARGKGFNDPLTYRFKTSGLEVFWYGLEPDPAKKMEAAWGKQVKFHPHFARERFDGDEMRLPQPPPVDTRLFARKKVEASR